MPNRRGALPGAIVLHATVHIVRNLIVDRNVVKLAHWEVVHKGPVLPSVSADVQSPIVSVDEILRVRGVDVQRMVIGVDPTVGKDDVERAPAIGRL